MISRLVTVDLLVTAATRINSQRPQGDPIKLFSSVVEILNCWAHKIESQGVSVSVECILDNVFWLKEQQQCVEWDDFKNLGLDLIETAAEFDSRLTSDRCLQSVSRPQMERVERAPERQDKVAFREAAKIVTGVKNPTEASESCRKCLNWCISESYIRH